MGKNKVKQITIKTIKKSHLHTCDLCKSDDVNVYSREIANCGGVGIAHCQNCKAVKEF